MKRVLPHGQSRLFHDDEENSECNHMCCCSKHFFFCKRQTDKTITHASESPTNVLQRYRSQSDHHQKCTHRHSINGDDAKSEERTRTDEKDEQFVLAEEGLSSMNNEEPMCPICIESFHVGEEVAWSNLGHCRHVFHLNCIMPWAVLGNLECPVCREEFWSANAYALQSCLCMVEKHRPFGFRSWSISEMKQSRFCVQHGLVSPES